MNGLLAAGVKIVSIGARPTFQLILLAIFIYFFGLPIIETYQKKEVMTLVNRVAKCHRYGKYICVKILESWGKECRRPRIFVK